MTKIIEHRPKLLIIEGNIGAGKSTFLKIVQETNHTKIINLSDD